jgi:hypothetical protein
MVQVGEIRMSNNLAYREPIYGHIKRGIVGTRRYPWGSNKGPAEAGRPFNANGIFPVHYNFFTGANVSVQAMPRNDQRRFLQIQNMSLASDIVFLFGGSASLNDGITLTPGQVEIFDVSCPTESLSIFCSAGGQRVAMIEGY